MKKLLLLILLPMLLNAQPNVVPNPTSRGSLGQATNQWTAVYADAYYGPIMTMHEAYYTSNTTATVNPGAGTWHQVTNVTWNAGDVAMAGWTIATNALIYTNSDPVMVHGAATVSFAQGNTVGNVYLAVATNGVPLYRSLAQRKIGTAGDVGSTALHPMFMAEQDDALQLYIMSDATGDVTIQHFNFVIVSMPQ